ncbi:reverse transcriptase-like protein [Candidatus Saccharibacteria bacterium]|nr:reverse transcriptase-like protein [Candidatus Saccharibacteria bacterium]
MKQRIRVVAIIRNHEGDLLLLQKDRLNAEQPRQYEFLSGKLEIGEQPEDAVARLVHDYLNSTIQSVSLLDVIALAKAEDPTQASLFIVFGVTLASAKIDINHDQYLTSVWAKQVDIPNIELMSESSYILGVVEKGVAEGAEHHFELDTDLPDYAVVYTDGGSRGNPGPSAAGYYILSPQGEVLDRGGEFIGITNSRQAEYIALKLGVEKAIQLGLNKVVFKVDNLMLAGHMNGTYKIKNRELWPIYDEINLLLKKIESAAFKHVTRDKNVQADSEVNRVLDEHAVK